MIIKTREELEAEIIASKDKINVGPHQDLLLDMMNTFYNETLQWKDQWNPDTNYTINNMVNDDGWLMVSNKDTNDRPAPQPIGSQITPVGSASFSTESNVSVVLSGTVFTFTKGGWITRYLVYPTTTGANIEHNAYIIRTSPGGNPIIVEFRNLSVTAGQWNPLIVGRDLILPGEVILVFLETTNSSSNTQFTFPWVFRGSDTIQPSVGDWNRSASSTILRINKTDSNLVDRSGDLSSIIPGTEIKLTETSDVTRFETYDVFSSTDTGSAFEFEVVLINQGSNRPRNNRGCDVEVTISVPLSSNYSEELGFWSGNQPSFANVEGFLQFDNVNQTNPGNAYGGDIEFQQGALSTDWDFAAFSGN